MGYCKWKLVNKKGRKISGFRLKSHAKKAQLKSGRADRYVKKC